MGWLEILPLLRRVLPLLDRLAPMLESLLAGRIGGRAATEANSASLTEISGTFTALRSMLDQQHASLESLTVRINETAASISVLQVHSLQVDNQLATLARFVRLAAVSLGALLLVNLALLIIVLLRHS